MFEKYFHWRWLIYILVFGFWSFWLLQQRVDSFDRYIVDDCLSDIKGQRPMVLVLGAAVQKNYQLSPIFADRLDTAIELYEAALVKKILVSGDHGDELYDEVNAAKNYLLAKGVPASDIFLDHAGFDTYDSLYRAKSIFAADAFLIVTQDFHLSRALFIAQRLDLQAWGCRADKRFYADAEHLKYREWLASVKAWLDVNLRSKPSFGGASFDLSGDGQMTWDEFN
jgi:SanA protein